MPAPVARYPVPPQERAERLALLAGRGAQRRIERGVVFIREGDKSNGIYIIQSGTVQVFSADEYQRELLFGTYGAGETVGEVSLDGARRIASVRAVTDVQCVEVNRAEVLQFIGEHPLFALDLFGDIVDRMRNARESLRNMVFLDTYARLRRLLHEEADADQEFMDGVRGIVRLTHRDIATRIGCSREMVSKLLKEASDKGYLAMHRGQIRVLKRLPERW